MISQANVLVARFQTFDARLNELRIGVNRQIGDAATQINSVAQNISDLNEEIVRSSSGTGNQPNDLLDKRDQLVADLNKLVRATTVAQADGTINVFIGTGQPLVLNSQAFSLTASASAADPQNDELFYLANGNRIPISASSLQGGSLGALLAFRSETLDTVQNNLGRVAVVLAQTVNDQHRSGRT